jgi:hypothetical protein
LCCSQRGVTQTLDPCVSVAPAGVGHRLQAGAAGVTSKLSGMGWGPKQGGKAKVEPEDTSKEAEMTAASPGVTTRRRMAAAPASGN